MPLPTGTVLQGRYRVERVLGAGAFGRVYLAEDTQDPGSPRLAIKELLDAQFPSPDDKREAITWFKREVSTLLTLEHPGIPAVHGYWTAQTSSGPLYLAMEYIPGKTLEEVAQDAGGQVRWQQVAAWGIALCEVLSYLHSRTPPFVFRDLKLPNVMLDSRTSRPVLIDFGIARQLAAVGGTAIGTWGYAPYEQVPGKAEPRSDLYALGALLHALLTGRRPDAEYTRLQRGGLDVATTMRALFPPADTLVPGIPAGLAQVLTRATAFDAADRFLDAASMAVALQQVLQPSAAGAGPGSAATSSFASPAVPQTQTIVVSKLGRGHFTTISEALHNAQAGTRIEVHQGLYREAEAVLIDKPVEIVAVGRVEDVTVEAIGDSCIIMESDYAVIRGLTLRGRVEIPHGRLVLEDCHITHDPTSDAAGFIDVYGPSANPLIRRCLIHDAKGYGIGLAEAHGTVEDCDICHADIAIRDGNPLIRRCRIHEGKAAGVWVFGNGQGTVEDCDIFGNTHAGVWIGGGSNPVIRRCSIHDGNEDGVWGYDNGQGTVEDCDIFGNAQGGVSISGGGNPVIQRCRIHDGKRVGVWVTDSGQRTVEDCDIFGNAQGGVTIANGGDPVIRGCRIHDDESCGVYVYNSGEGTVEGCDIFGNARAGVTIMDGGDPVIRGCRINRNGGAAIQVFDRGAGSVETCDLTGNTSGAWDIERGCQVRRRGNKT